MAVVTLEDEIKRNPELKLSDVRSLREWCDKQPHLPKIEDSFLALFLHSNYYRMEPTKCMIENYYTTRTHVPEFFSDRDPLKMNEQFFQVGTAFPLEKRTMDGCTIMYNVSLDADPSRFVLNDLFKYYIIMFDLHLLTEGTSNGIVFVVDIKGTTVGHVARMNPLTIKKGCYYLQEALPIRIRGIHFINTTPIMDLIMNIIRPFLKKEIADMIHFHPTVESASKYLPVEALPDEALPGGKAGPTRRLAEIQMRKMMEYREWLVADERTGRVNENLRVGKSKSASDLFGVEGNFRKLEVD